MAHVTYTSIMTLMTAAGKMGDVRSEYVERMHAWIDDAQKRDIRVTQCITDAKGDRSRPPHQQDDPDAYTRVVERRRTASSSAAPSSTSPALRSVTS